MKVNGSIDYKNSTTLNENQIREIDAIVNEYLGTPEYSAELISGDKITFDNLEELLHFDNFENRKIEKIIIRVDYGTYIYIDCDSKIYPVHGDYGISSVDKSDEFKRKIISVLNKGKRNKIYEFFAMSYYIGVFFSIWVTITIYSFLMSNPSELKKLPNGVSYLIVMICALFGILLFYLLEKINKWIKSLFPRLVLYIGEEKEKENKREKLRGNIFWVIVVGLLVSISGGLLPNIFK